MIVGRNRGRKQTLKNGDEVDCIVAKRFYCYLQKPGVSRKIKQRLNRRLRRELKLELKRRMIFWQKNPNFLLTIYF